MSNYNCPQCGEPILDTPGGPNEKHICTYIPYSKRNGITDPDLGGLIDYLERVMGWEIELRNLFNTCVILDKNSLFGIYYMKNDDFEIGIGVQNRKRHAFSTCYIEGKTEIFFRTYKTLLPVIRDLYSK